MHSRRHVQPRPRPSALEVPLLGAVTALPPFTAVAAAELAAAELVLWLAAARLSGERILAQV